MQIHIEPPVAFVAREKGKINELDFVQHANQLQFNLQSSPQVCNMQTKFQKPRPIIIEKLPQAKAENCHIARDFPVQERQTSSSLSSERLQLAMQLAKRDVKKLKSMLVDPHPGDFIYQGHPDENAQPDKEENRETRNKSSVQTSVIARNKEKEKKPVGKVVSGRQSKVDMEHLQMNFYDCGGQPLENEEELKKGLRNTREVSEIKRLRKELQKYMKRLDSLLEQRGNQKTDLSAKKKGMFEEVEYERKESRAAEQASRAARILYMLQRKVQELQDELQEKGSQMKHTKKSQSLARLAAAHRSAVRALQMFVNQAPVYYDLNHGLPSMYQELGLLIQQLSLLSSHYDEAKDLPAFDLDLLPRTKKLISSWDPTNRIKSKTERRKGQDEEKKSRNQRTAMHPNVKDRFLDGHEDWINQRAQAIGFHDKGFDSPTKSNEATPEREAALQAGIDAIQRAKQSASFIAQDMSKESRGSKFRIPKKVSKDRQKSVLFPHRIKKYRQRELSIGHQKKGNQLKAGHDAEQAMPFAKQTVSSVLKKNADAPYHPKKSKSVLSRRNHNRIPEDVYVRQGTPKERDAEILKMASPRSPKCGPMFGKQQSSTASRFDDEEYRQGLRNISEKEIARQAWLDRERDREIQMLQNLRMREEERVEERRSENNKTQAIVDDAEERIKRQLQPLLEKAELLSLQEKLREDDYKFSVKRKLADLVADTAMSRGELLADLILEDILTETVYELQSIEDEEKAEAKAAFELDKPSIESISQRLAQFEAEEEQIRRRWEKLHYSEIDIVNSERPRAANQGHSDAADAAKPIVFTSSKEKDHALDVIKTTVHGNYVKGDIEFDTSENVDFIPSEMKASILSYRRQHENYLKRTITVEHGTFNPWVSVEKVSDDIVEELVAEVEKELNVFCDEYVEDVYADEFVKNDSAISEHSTVTCSR